MLITAACPDEITSGILLHNMYHRMCELVISCLIICLFVSSVFLSGTNGKSTTAKEVNGIREIAEDIGDLNLTETDFVPEWISEERRDMRASTSEEEKDIKDSTSEEENDIEDSTSNEENDIQDSISEEENDIEDSTSNEENDIKDSNSEEEKDIEDLTSEEENDMEDSTSNGENDIEDSTLNEKNDIKDSISNEEKDTKDSTSKEEKGINDSTKNEEKDIEDSTSNEEKDIEDSISNEEKDIEDSISKEDDDVEDSASEEEKDINDSTKKEEKDIEDSTSKEDDDVEDSASEEDDDVEDSASEEEKDINDSTKKEEKDIEDSTSKEDDDVEDSASEEEKDIEDPTLKEERVIVDTGSEEDDIWESISKEEEDIGDSISKEKKDIGDSVSEEEDIGNSASEEEDIGDSASEEGIIGNSASSSSSSSEEEDVGNSTSKEEDDGVDSKLVEIRDLLHFLQIGIFWPGEDNSNGTSGEEVTTEKPGDIGNEANNVSNVTSVEVENIRKKAVDILKKAKGILKEAKDTKKKAEDIKYEAEVIENSASKEAKVIRKEAEGIWNEAKEILKEAKDVREKAEDTRKEVVDTMDSVSKKEEDIGNYTSKEVEDTSVFTSKEEKDFGDSEYVEIRDILQFLETEILRTGEDQSNAPEEGMVTLRELQKRDSHGGSSVSNKSNALRKSSYTCPVLKYLLFEYFKGFPNINETEDNIIFSTSDFEASIRKSMVVFKVLNGNLRVTLEELAEDLSRVVLKKRTKCPVTMFQQMLVYALRTELNNMLAKDGKSLNHHILLVLRDSLPGVSTPELERVTKEIVKNVNNIVFETLISHIQYEEFRCLNTFLEDFIKQADSLFVKYRGSAVMFRTLMRALQTALQNHPKAFKCTTLPELVKLHSRLTNDFSKQFIELEQSGMIMHLAKNIISKTMQTFGTRVSSASGDQAVKWLASITVNFMKEKTYILQQYEAKINSLAKGIPPHFLLLRLNKDEKIQMKALLKRITQPKLSTANPFSSTADPFSSAYPFSPTPVPVSATRRPLFMISKEELISHLQMDAQNLKQLHNWLMQDVYNGNNKNMVYPTLETMLIMKNALMQKLGTNAG